MNLGRKLWTCTLASPTVTVTPMPRLIRRRGS
jgi:hypothetical protein